MKKKVTQVVDKKDKIALEKRLIQERISQSARQYYPDESVSPVAVRVKLYYPSLTDWERRYRCEVTLQNDARQRTKRRIFAKRGPSGEYIHLNRLWKLYEQHGINPVPLPRPLDHIPECSVSLMDWLDGVLCTQFLKWHLLTPIYQLRRDKVQAVIGQIAAWLAQFNAVTASGKFYDVTEDANHALRLLERIQTISDEERSRLASHLTALSRRTYQVPQVLHGEFAPRNVMLTPRGIIVFDWVDLCETYFGYNVHTFFAALRRFPQRVPLLYSRKTVSELEKIFISRYRDASCLDWSDEIYEATAALWQVNYLSRAEGSHEYTVNQSVANQ
jgi:hypothetical protein